MGLTIAALCSGSVYSYVLMLTHNVLQWMPTLCYSVRVGGL